MDDIDTELLRAVTLLCEGEPEDAEIERRAALLEYLHAATERGEWD